MRTMTIVALLALASPAAAQTKPAPCYNPYAGVCENPYVFRDFGQAGLTLARAAVVVEAERAQDLGPEWAARFWEKAWREGGGFSGGTAGAAAGAE
jgi:hypothetical protein